MHRLRANHVSDEMGNISQRNETVIEQEKNEKTNSRNDALFQQDDAVKLIQFLNEKGIIEVDNTGKIRVPDTGEHITTHIDKKEQKAAQSDMDSHKSTPNEKTYLPVFSADTPDHIRTSGIKLINLLVNEGLIMVDTNGIVTLPYSKQSISLEDFLRAVFYDNKSVKKKHRVFQTNF